MKSSLLLLLAIPLLFGSLMHSSSCRDSSTSSNSTASGATPNASRMTQDASTPRPNPSPTTGSHQIPTGMWGGNHTVMQISPQGASVEFDCANGKIAGPMATDDSGHFDVAGTYSPEGPGPIREDKPRESRARYSGTVTGDTMLLTLRLEGSSEMLVSVSLTHGKPGKLRKCY